MKTPDNARGAGLLFSGLTLTELTLTISIVLGLVSILFAGTGMYQSQADRAGCIIAQNQMRKALVSYSNITNLNFEPGVDYYTDVFSAGLFEEQLTCPESGGAYTIFLDESGRGLVITCHDHGDNHRQ
jgi:hypothetical protein